MRLHWPDLNIVVAVLRARGRNLTFSYPLFSMKEYTGVSRNAESDESVNADRATPKGIMGSVSLPLFDRSYQCFIDSFSSLLDTMNPSIKVNDPSS